MKRSFWIILCVLAVLAGWQFWPSGSRPVWAAKTASTAAPAPALQAPTPLLPAVTSVIARSAASTNREFYRLSNTPKTIGQLSTATHAILLENALIDTTVGLDLKIPSHLRASGDPGAYIVQARGPVDGPFRALLAGAGAQIVSYIPNNAYLVQLTSLGASALAGNARVQAVLPFEPYYKISSSIPVGTVQKLASVKPSTISETSQPTLLELAVRQKPLPAGTYLTLGLFGGGAASTEAQIRKLGGVIVAWDRSPFGPMVRVQPPADWLALVQLPGVQIVEPAHHRVAANDLTRATTGVAVSSTNQNDYLNLRGSNVLVEVNDTGIDQNQPDLIGRLLFDSPGSGYDTDGHGTFVAGQIAGSGAKSLTVTKAQGSVMPPVNGQFRGMAPSATLFSVGGIGSYGNNSVGGNDTNFFVIGQTNFFIPGPSIYVLGPAGETNYFYPGGFPDWYLQEAPAATNALISNNSWNNDGSPYYDLAAASYDAAVRDALPEVTGPQPVLFVFSAGNDGGGSDNGSLGNSDTILSPATAKNVITVGALEQYRNITNTYPPFGSTNPVAPWLPETDSSFQVASYSARGNVGVGIEGANGRFKPDVVAPGSFVISTRTTTWDTSVYYSPTNYHFNTVNAGQVIDTSYFNFYQMLIPSNAVSIVLSIVPNSLSPAPFPTLEFFVTATNGTGLNPADSSSYDFTKTANTVTIPPDGNLQSFITSGNLYFAITDGTNTLPVNYDLVEEIITTNDNGNYYQVLSNLNNTVGPNYRYETGTSMAAADVSGVLALMQDFFTNTLHTTPSPALLKALLINGAQVAGNYGYAITNGFNFEGWGLVNLPASVPAKLTSASINAPAYYADQNPINALATGDSRTYTVTVPSASQGQPLRATLVWTDPPGNPAAGIKLVNNLDLIVTNLTSGRFYTGNNFASSIPPYSLASTTNGAPVFDSVNNVENIIIPANLGATYSVTVIGRNVTVNAVTAEQTNIVQDYALVVSCGSGTNVNGITVTPPVVTASSTAPQVTVVGITNGIYFNQTSGANAPWLSTNAIVFGPGYGYATNASLFIGQTNQWHFFVVPNTSTFSNAAFITFLPVTLAIPREGVFAGSDANSTRPEADLNLFVASESSLTNLDPVAISNCIYAVNGDQASVSRGGTKFIVYSNAAPGQVYYVGVQCEDQMAGQFGFVPIFSQNSFSQSDNNQNLIVLGLSLPAVIPDGNNRYPGVGYVIAMATPSDPTMAVRNVLVTNIITHQNFGDLLGFLSHDDIYAVLNNHDALKSVVNQSFIYDDSGQSGVPAALHTDGPGSLNDFIGQPAVGPWILAESDDAPGDTGSITGFSLEIQPHVNLGGSGTNTVTIPPNAWFYDYADVPPGYTNILVLATNITPAGTLSASPVQLYLGYQTEPTASNYLAEADLTSSTPGIPPGNSVTQGPPLLSGRYFIGLFNPDPNNPQLVSIQVKFSPSGGSGGTTVDYDSTGPVPLLDDAVTYAYQNVTNTDLIEGFKVGLCVSHPRISDLVFHLISPDGTRYLIMENRGGQDTNGCGIAVVNTNFISGGSTNLVISTNVTTSFGYLDFTEDTNYTSTPIKYAVPPLVPASLATVFTNVFTNAFGTNSVVMTNLMATNVYYLAEQSLSPLIGISAAGIWQLEVLDNRAGATNPAPSLQSWQLEFNFANASQLPSTNLLVGGIPQTNTVGTNSLSAGSILWYTVNVPTSASYATNILIFSTAPVNLWFSTNSPQTITNAGDVELLTNSIGNTASPYIMFTNTATWPYIVPGGTYYLGVQNTNSFVVTNAVEVDFDHGNSTNSVLPSFVIKGVKVSGGATQITWAVSGGATYQVQWKNSLTNAWNTITDPATTISNGIAAFTDNGSQTAPRGPMRFYRLVRLP